MAGLYQRKDGRSATNSSHAKNEPCWPIVTEIMTALFLKSGHGDTGLSAATERLTLPQPSQNPKKTSIGKIRARIRTIECR
jgi:hypothetical protein